MADLLAKIHHCNATPAQTALRIKLCYAYTRSDDLSNIINEMISRNLNVIYELYQMLYPITRAPFEQPHSHVHTNTYLTNQPNDHINVILSFCDALSRVTLQRCCKRFASFTLRNPTCEYTVLTRITQHIRKCYGINLTIPLHTLYAKYPGMTVMPKYRDGCPVTLRELTIDSELTIALNLPNLNVLKCHAVHLQHITAPHVTHLSVSGDHHEYIQPFIDNCRLVAFESTMCLNTSLVWPQTLRVCKLVCDVPMPAHVFSLPDGCRLHLTTENNAYSVISKLDIPTKQKICELDTAIPIAMSHNLTSLRVLKSPWCSVTLNGLEVLRVTSRYHDYHGNDLIELELDTAWNSSFMQYRRLWKLCIHESYYFPSLPAQLEEFEYNGDIGLDDIQTMLKSRLVRACIGDQRGVRSLDQSRLDHKYSLIVPKMPMEELAASRIVYMRISYGSDMWRWAR